MPDTPDCTNTPEGEKAMKTGDQIIREAEDGLNGVEREGGTEASRPLSRHEQRQRTHPNHGRDVNDT